MCFGKVRECFSPTAVAIKDRHVAVDRSVAAARPNDTTIGAKVIERLQGDELLGLSSNEIFSNSLNRFGIQHSYYFYAHDDWRATLWLTLNLGLRYELPPRYFQTKKQDTTFVPGSRSTTPRTMPFRKVVLSTCCMLTRYTLWMTHNGFREWSNELHEGVNNSSISRAR